MFKRIALLTAAAITFVAAIEDPAHAGPRKDAAVGAVIYAMETGCDRHVPDEVLGFLVMAAAEEESTDVETVMKRVAVDAVITVAEWSASQLREYCRGMDKELGR